MSFNVLAAWPHAIVSASDRRLVGLLAGDIRTNRSTKMTIFACADAHGVIVYNGIGMDPDGLTPSDWLLELEEKAKLFNRRLIDVLDAVMVDLESRLRPIRAQYGPKKTRHTFMLGVWHEGASVVFGLSNYERMDENKEETEGSEKVMLSVLRPAPKAEVRIVTTGMHSRRCDRRGIAQAIKAGALNRVRAMCVKAVRGVAYGTGKAKGAAGASAQWAVLGADRAEVWYGLDVAGGAIAQETPNLINIAANVFLGGTVTAQIGGPGILIKGTCVGDERASSVAGYDSAKKAPAFPEPRCKICGAPWPVSHRICEVCLYERHRDKSQRQRPTR